MNDKVVPSPTKDPIGYLQYVAFFLGSTKDISMVDMSDGLWTIISHLKNVNDAMNNEGKHPPYHRRAVAKLYAEWPYLYHALRIAFPGPVFKRRPTL